MNSGLAPVFVRYRLYLGLYKGLSLLENQRFVACSEEFDDVDRDGYEPEGLPLISKIRLLGNRIRDFDYFGLLRKTARDPKYHGGPFTFGQGERFAGHFEGF